MVSDVYESGLVQIGPPPGANNARLRYKGYYVCETLADLRAIDTDPLNATDYPMAILQGWTAKYDGLLQGIYFYVGTGSHNSRADDGGGWIIVNDGRSAWQKLT